MRGSADNLLRVFTQARPWELIDGQQYYDRQRMKLERRADGAALPLTAVVAAFCALSPNNSEKSTYRALDTCLGIVDGRFPEHTKVISYTPNRTKALALLRGAPIKDTLRGRKVTAFYHNTLDSRDNRWVTVDGHMLGAWCAQRLVLRREALVKASEYPIISDHFRSAAECYKLPAPQFQATLWLVWKRINRILWNGQMCFSWEEEL
jgi:hypothetical protein